jgi:hypothetical protein
MLAIRMNNAQCNAAHATALDTYVIVRPESPGNVWGFWTEADALAAVRQQVDSGGAATVSGWSLVRVPSDQDADWQTIAEDGRRRPKTACSKLASSDPNRG